MTSSWKLTLAVLAVEAVSIASFTALPIRTSAGRTVDAPHDGCRGWTHNRPVPALSVFRYGDDSSDAGDSNDDQRHAHERSFFDFGGDGSRGGDSGSSGDGPQHRQSQGSFRQRQQQQQQEKSPSQQDADRFISGDDLHRLRHHVLAMRLELQEARRNSDDSLVSQLEQAIVQAQQSDAEFVYSVSLERMQLAEQEGRFVEAARLQQQAKAARDALPQFQLEGLWVGKYSEEAGYEMINVTYVGDVLVAHKVTGTKNVPQGQATFQVDLGPHSEHVQALAPIELGEHASKQWGSKYLQRFAGVGQVAAEGYRDSQWIDGQLILVNDYFSFAWLPIGHQVFFGRPTAELVLRLMQQRDDSASASPASSDGPSQHDRQQPSTRSYLEKCWEETEYIQDDMDIHGLAPGSCIDGSSLDRLRPESKPAFDLGEGCFE